MFNNTLGPDERSNITVVNAYRLGKYQPNARPRKILVELSNFRCKDLVLKHAKTITKANNNGMPFYLNEDIPEQIKRKKSDLLKYKQYMEDRNHKIDQFGDFFIIIGERFHLTELNNLPIGDRLMDSRTIYKRGTVAFQSAMSPLSNLFPCKVKYNGLSFTSTEQIFQYTKALHHGLYDLARDIKCENDPYVILAMTKNSKLDDDWIDNRFSIMEGIIRHKEDQVPVFKQMLKLTNNHRLVENSTNEVWGSACPFQSPAVWNGTFRGQNLFGRVLERVQDST